jgi:hypothetical protein
MLHNLRTQVSRTSEPPRDPPMREGLAQVAYHTLISFTGVSLQPNPYVETMHVLLITENAVLRVGLQAIPKPYIQDIHEPSIDAPIRV